MTTAKKNKSIIDAALQEKLDALFKAEGCDIATIPEALDAYKTITRKTILKNKPKSATINFQVPETLKNDIVEIIEKVNKSKKSKVTMSEVFRDALECLRVVGGYEFLNPAAFKELLKAQDAAALVDTMTAEGAKDEETIKALQTTIEANKSLMQQMRDENARLKNGGAR